MARQIICDKCRRPCQRIVLKLYVAPKNGERPGGDHANYTGHADIGECCTAEVTGMFKWTKRRSRAGSTRDALAARSAGPSSA